MYIMLSIREWHNTGWIGTVWAKLRVIDKAQLHSSFCSKLSTCWQDGYRGTCKGSDLSATSDVWLKYIDRQHSRLPGVSDVSVIRLPFPATVCSWNVYSCWCVCLCVCVGVCMHVCVHRLCVCVYVFICVCMHVCAHRLCVCECARARIHVHAHLCVCENVCLCEWGPVWVCACMHVRACIYVHTLAHCTLSFVAHGWLVHGEKRCFQLGPLSLCIWVWRSASCCHLLQGKMRLTWAHTYDEQMRAGIAPNPNLLKSL